VAGRVADGLKQVKKQKLGDLSDNYRNSPGRAERVRD
jgi:hypothetical protein